MLAVLDPEQEMLRKTIRAVATGMAVRNPQDLETVDENKSWQTLTETGLLGLRLREEGTPIASGVEAMLVAHELGAALATAPYIWSGVLAVELLSIAGLDDLAESVAGGSEQPGILVDGQLLGLADPDDETAVLLGASAPAYALALRRSDGGGQLVRVETGPAFKTRESADLTRHVSTRVLDGPQPSCSVIGEPISCDNLDRWLALALTLVSADCAGSMRTALDEVVDYTKERIAYGAPIGSFQALQHLCADAFTACEGAVTANDHAAWAVDGLSPHEALLAARTAKAWIDAVAREVVEVVMQVYGGIGQTWEHIAHVHARRALFATSLLGDEGHQLDQIYLLRTEGA